MKGSRLGIVGGLLAAGAALAGCELNFTDPFGKELADVVSDLRVVDGETKSLRFTATLLPGRDADGEERILAEDALEILGEEVTPESVGSRGQRTYSHEWTVPGDAPLSPLTFRVPGFEPLAGGDPMVGFGACERPSRDDLRISPGDTLRLEVGCGDREPALRQTRWRLEVRWEGSGGLLLVLDSSLPPPPVIQVPAAWLVRGGLSDLEAVLTVIRTFVLEGPGWDYRVGLQVRWVFPWTVRWVEEEVGGSPFSTPAPRPGAAGEPSPSLPVGAFPRN